MNAKRGPVYLLILALMLVMIAPAGGETAAEDPVVVRVGSISYPLSMVQSSLDDTLDMAGALYEAPIEAQDREAGIAAASDKFVTMGLIESKLAEAGKNDFTKAEDEMLKSAAQSKYEELWQILYQRMQQSNEEVSEEDVTAAMDAEGYTVEAIYDEYVVTERNHRAVELFCQDVTINQEQPAQYYPVSKFSVVVPLSGSKVQLVMTTPSGQTREVYQGMLNTGTYRISLSSDEPGVHTVEIHMDGVLMERQVVKFE